MKEAKSNYQHLVNLVRSAKPSGGCIEWKRGVQRGRYVKIRHGNKMKYAHRLALTIFSGKDDEDLQCVHTCGNPRCVNPYHLKWKDAGEMYDRRIAKGNDNSGERCANAKMTWEDVDFIRSNPDGLTKGQLAIKYKCNPKTIYHIQKGNTWKEKNRPQNVQTTGVK